MERQKPFSAWCYQAEEMRLLKLPFREEWGGREIPLQTHLSEQLLKWKCRSSETFEFPPIAREEEGGRRERGLLSHANSNAGAHSGSTQPAAQGICQGVHQDQHEHGEAGCKGQQVYREGNE